MSRSEQARPRARPSACLAECLAAHLLESASFVDYLGKLAAAVAKQRVHQGPPGMEPMKALPAAVAIQNRSTGKSKAAEVLLHAVLQR